MKRKSRMFVSRKKRQASRIFRRNGRITRWMRKRRVNKRLRKEWYKLRDRCRFFANNALVMANIQPGPLPGADVQYVLAWGKVLAIPNQGLGPSEFRGRRLNTLILKARLTVSLTPTVFYQNTGTTEATISAPSIIPTACRYRIIIYQVKSGEVHTNSGQDSYLPTDGSYHQLAIPDTSATFVSPSVATQLQQPGTMTSGNGINLNIQNAVGGPGIFVPNGIISELLQYTPTAASFTNLGASYFGGTDLIGGYNTNEIIRPTSAYLSILNGQFRDGITKQAIILYDKTYSLGTNNDRSIKTHKLKIRCQPYVWQEQVGTEDNPFYNISNWPVNCIYMLVIPIFNQYSFIPTTTPATLATSYGTFDFFSNMELIYTDD